MKRMILLAALLAAMVLQSVAQPPVSIMVMRGARIPTIKKDTLWGAYCYREINGQISGVTRQKNPFQCEYLPLREGEKMLYYVLADPCTVSLKLHLHAEKKAQPMLNVKVTEMNTGNVISNKLIKTKFKGGAESVFAMQTKSLPSRSWYCIELTAQNWLAINSIDMWEIERDGDTAIKPSPIFMAPSVHLNGWTSTDPAAPKGEAYDWAYMEVMLPKKYERKNTYVMSLGVLSGYMGMQTIDDEGKQNYKHRVLFSMWDKGNTDEDRNLPDFLRSGALDKGENVEIERFGGEGTGTKSMIYESHWQCDNWVQFITTCRPERLNIKAKGSHGQDTIVEYTNTLVSAWYKEANEQEWHYLSTLREASRNHYMSGWYSFLENFTDDGGNIYRRAYYRNGFLHSLTDNKWYPRNQVGFGHTQGKPEHPRYDYGHGVTAQYPNCFYLEQGGYSLNANDSATTLPLTTDFTPVDTINLQNLWGRMQQAIRNESTREMDILIGEAASRTDKLAAFKQLAQEYIDSVGKFDYYAKEDLKNLEIVYNNGNTTDAAGLALYLRELARWANPLKQGKPIKVEHIGATRAYQILLDSRQILEARNGAIALTNDNLATCQARNWRFIRKAGTDKFVVQNLQTNQYLNPAADSMLSAEPVEITVEPRSNEKGFVLSAGGRNIECALIDNYWAGK